MAPAIAPVSASRVVGSPMLGGPSGVRAAAAPAPASLTLTQNLFGRPLKPKMIAQRMAGVLGAESATALQDGREPQGTSLQSRSSKARPYSYRLG